jgi:hypothetical protein
MIRLEPIDNSTMIRVHTGNPSIGNLRLWVPEAVVSNSGISAVYPVSSWFERGRDWGQSVSGEDIVGPGSYRRVDETTFESRGRRFPADNPVEWTTHVSATETAVDFTMELRNLGNSLIQKAGAAICLRFLDAGWWSAETAFVISNGRLRSLAELDSDSGEPREYQAYLLEDQSYDNIIYTEGWRFSRHRVQKPFLVSQNTTARACVLIHAQNAYFVHRNIGNEGPCTDLMLAFGDVGAGEVAKASGCIWIKDGLAEDLIADMGL